MFLLLSAGIVKVRVQTIDGSSFGMTMEQGGTVADLKSEIQEAQGAAWHRQQLFMLSEGAEGRSEAQAAVGRSGGRTLVHGDAMRAQAEDEWSWDASSPQLERKVLELRGPNNSIAAKIDEDEDSRSCMMAGPVMEAGAGKHTISMQLAGGLCYCPITHCGAVSDGAACDEYHGSQDSTVGYFVYSGNGGMCGNGKLVDDGAGPIESGDVLPMQVDTDAGTLKFWKNGEPHGPGYTNGVRGLLQWAAWIYNVRSTVAIVPTPAALQQ